MLLYSLRQTCWVSPGMAGAAGQNDYIDLQKVLEAWNKLPESERKPGAVQVGDLKAGHQIGSGSVEADLVGIGRHGHVAGGERDEEYPDKAKASRHAVTGMTRGQGLRYE